MDSCLAENFCSGCDQFVPSNRRLPAMGFEHFERTIGGNCTFHYRCLVTLLHMLRHGRKVDDHVYKGLPMDKVNTPECPRCDSELNSWQFGAFFGRYGTVSIVAF